MVLAVAAAQEPERDDKTGEGQRYGCHPVDPTRGESHHGIGGNDCRQLHSHTYSHPTIGTVAVAPTVVDHQQHGVEHSTDEQRHTGTGEPQQPKQTYIKGSIITT